MDEKGDVQDTAEAGQERKRTTATAKKKPSADEDMVVDDGYEEAPKPKKVSSQTHHPESCTVHLDFNF